MKVIREAEDKWRIEDISSLDMQNIWYSIDTMRALAIERDNQEAFDQLYAMLLDMSDQYILDLRDSYGFS